MYFNIVPRDTTLEAARIQFSILRRIGAEGRAKMAIELNNGLRATVESGVRQRHPDYDDNRVRLAVLCLTIGDELFHKVYANNIEVKSLMNQENFLAQLVKKLEDAGISYMISGSLGSSLHGEPRATNDIDLIIAPTAMQLNTFIQSLSEGYYISPEAAQEALRNRSMFNVIDQQTGWKADLIIRKDRPFSLEEFRRRIPGNIMGVQVFVVSPEDAILSKLEWSKEGESERQFQDALGITAVQWKNLDKEYLQKWAQELGVEDLLERLLSNAEKLQLSK